MWKSRVITSLWQNDYKSKYYGTRVDTLLDFYLVNKEITPSPNEAKGFTISRTTLPDFLCEAKFCHMWHRESPPLANSPG